VFFVDSVVVAVVVVSLAIPRWIVSIIVGAEPRAESLRKLFENFMTGLTV
jgi:hypothetical protein